MDKNEKREMLITVSVICSILILIICLIVNYYSAENVTKRQIKVLVNEKIRTKNVSTGLMSVIDGWDNNYKASYLETKSAKTYIVRSAGEDGKFHTADDIVAERKDFNKSRIVGKYITDKISEGIGGVKDSISDTLNKPKDKDHEGLSKKIGKKIGQTIKDFKNGFKEGDKDD